MSWDYSPTYVCPSIRPTGRVPLNHPFGIPGNSGSPQSIVLRTPPFIWTTVEDGLAVWVRPGVVLLVVTSTALGSTNSSLHSEQLGTVFSIDQAGMRYACPVLSIAIITHSSRRAMAVMAFLHPRFSLSRR